MKSKNKKGARTAASIIKELHQRNLLPLVVLGTVFLAINVVYAVNTFSKNTEGDLPEYNNNFSEVENTEALSASLIPLKTAGVTASSSDSNLPKYTLDNDYDTRWSANGSGQWIMFDLGAPQEVNRVAISFYRGKMRIQKFSVETSLDKSNWTKVYSGQNSGTSTSMEFFNVAQSTARYVRVTGYGNSENKWNSLKEIDIYGSRLENPIPSISPSSAPSTTAKPSASSTPTVRPTATARPTQTAVPTSPPVSGDFPSNILNLTNWKITLPTGGLEKPTEIKQPTLTGYRNDPWFLTAGSGVRFRAPVTGVTTSGSNYPRSELREMTNNGMANASWTSNSGTHTMYIEEAITALPATKKHVVAGQVHDASDDVIVIRLEGSKLFIDIGGSDGPTLDSNYTLGKRFNVKFVVNGGKTSIYYNGASTPAYTLSKSYSGAYFKAGAYTQSNCSTEASNLCNDNNYGEVVIYQLSVSHN